MMARLLACALVILLPSVAAAQQSTPAIEPDGVTQLILALDKATETGDAEAMRALIAPEVRAALVAEFVQGLTFPKATQSAVKERDRAATANGGIRLLIETFTDRNGEGRVSSWRLDTQPGTAGGPWTIVGIERLTVVNGLFRLALDTTTEYEVRNLVVSAPNREVTISTTTSLNDGTSDQFDVLKSFRSIWKLRGR